MQKNTLSTALSSLLVSGSTRFLAFCALSAVLVITVDASASLLTPGDGPYTGLRRDQTYFIYDRSSRDFVEQVAAFQKSFRRLYDKSYAWQLDEEQDVVLASARNQVANAFTQNYPNIRTVWFPSGAAALERMATSSWILLLAAHENAHNYQLNPKSAPMAFIKPVVGNTPVLTPFFWPLFTTPNILLPTSLLEGNAVFNESRLNLGGRLHSGEVRALVLAQIRDHQINARRLINDEFKFPYGETAYVQGGYFQAHLAAKHGVDKTNQFFVAQSEHYLWPFILNKTFRRHFGTGFYQEVYEYLRGLEGLAAKQTGSSGIVLSAPAFAGPLNHDERRVWWLETSGKEIPSLVVVDKASGQVVERRQMDLELGKVFFVPPADPAVASGPRSPTDAVAAGPRSPALPVAAASLSHDLHHREFSLYGEGARFDPRYRGQIVSDIRAGKSASLDATNSWLDPHILVNGEFFDVGHSKPIVDGDGQVYYFRQNGADRILYRDRIPLLRYGGFYGKLTEVTADGSVYFIANTDYGCSLFRYRDGEVTRVVDSDKVQDARWLDDRRLLISEIESNGGKTIVTEASFSRQAPAVYAYAFATENVVPDKVMDSEQTDADARAYNSFRQLRFSGLNLELGSSSSSGINETIAAEFTDPLQYQSFNLGYTGSVRRYRNAFVNYSFSKYLPVFFAGYRYGESNGLVDIGQTLWLYTHELRMGVRLPIVKWRRWDAGLFAAGSFEREDPALINTGASSSGDTLAYANTGAAHDTYGTVSGFYVRHLNRPEYGFFPWREFDLNLTNQTATYPAKGWRLTENTSEVQIKYVRGLHKEFYLTGYGQADWAQNHDVLFAYNSSSLMNVSGGGGGPGAAGPSRFTLGRLTSGEPGVWIKSGAIVRVEAAKAFTTPAYFERIPIGVSRLTPFAVAQGSVLDRDRGYLYPASTFEWGVGLDLELLFAHKIPVRSRILRAYDTRNPAYAGGENQFNLSYLHEF